MEFKIHHDPERDKQIAMSEDHVIMIVRPDRKGPTNPANALKAVEELEYVSMFIDPRYLREVLDEIQDESRSLGTVEIGVPTSDGPLRIMVGEVVVYITQRKEM